jgi:hypothetical protein
MTNHIKISPSRIETLSKKKSQSYLHYYFFSIMKFTILPASYLLYLAPCALPDKISIVYVLQEAVDALSVELNELFAVAVHIRKLESAMLLERTAIIVMLATPT